LLYEVFKVWLINFNDFFHRVWMRRYLQSKFSELLPEWEKYETSRIHKYYTNNFKVFIKSWISRYRQNWRMTDGRLFLFSNVFSAVGFSCPCTVFNANSNLEPNAHYISYPKLSPRLSTTDHKFHLCRQDEDELLGVAFGFDWYPCPASHCLWILSDEGGFSTDETDYPPWVVVVVSLLIVHNETIHGASSSRRWRPSELRWWSSKSTTTPRSYATHSSPR
jgi:hypothetical protein